ncbi:hypothetical protein M758_7G124300 [Ceratodon purpureus]|nr:hypothetical protein M758_7G124300 [Ceratodon purpureus]
MEAVLVRATVATAGAVLQAGSHGHAIQVRVIAAERSSKVAPAGAADSSRKGSFRQSGFAAPHWSASSQSEMLQGPMRILWNSGCNIDQASRISEETSTILDEEELEEGFVNFETLDQSVADGNDDEVGCEYSRVVHTQESFTKFLRPLVSAKELKDVAQACYLSNLAYIISEIKGDELERDHRLRLITSSIQHENAAVTAQFNKTLRAPATAYALAATASYLQSRNGSGSKGSPKGEKSEKSTISSDVYSRAVDHEMAFAMSTFMDTAETNLSETSNLGGDGDVVTPTSNSSACGWFVCDEQATATRFFSIQGSESMASWKANLRFQPTQFENSNSGAMVHKGVYEIAKSLFDQMLPLVESHMAAYGRRAKISFTGHSLGGSLAVLLSLMFRSRGVVPVSALNQVYTFGAPSVLNGGNEFLKRLGFSPRHVQSVVIARDLVPRIFASDIPDQIVEVLKRVNHNFRNLPNFVTQRQLYTTTGQLLILQPEAQQAPGHPLLPSGSGLYRLDQPARVYSWNLANADTTDLRAAESCFLNSPHPLDIMSDPSAYGAEGAISRDHDPRSYRKAVNHVLKQTVRCLQRRKRMEIWHLREAMAQFPETDWPPSPAETPKRSKRTADSRAIFVHLDHDFSRASGACNYLNLGLRKSIHTRGTNLIESSRSLGRSRYG